MPSQLDECLISLTAVESSHWTASNREKLASFLTAALQAAAKTTPERTFVVFHGKSPDEWAKGGTLLSKARAEKDRAHAAASSTEATTTDHSPPPYDEAVVRTKNNPQVQKEEEVEKESS